MNSRERIIKTLSKEIPDRIPQLDTGFWVATIQRWQKEGFSADLNPTKGYDLNHRDLKDKFYRLCDYFNLDKISFVSCFDGSLQLSDETIEETEEYKITSNSNGVVSKSFKTETNAPPVQIDHTIKTFDDWKDIKKQLKVSEERIDEEDIKVIIDANKQNIFTAISPQEPCWFAYQELLGFENFLLSTATSPDFIEDIISTHTDFILGMMNLVLKREVKFDALWFASDLCYKNGMLFSPDTYKKLIMPYHKKVKDFCVKNDLFLILHCDGYVEEFIEFLIEAGFDCIQPLEARAGNDVRKLKKKYGNKICFWGNINADVIATGNKEEMEYEIKSKIETAKVGGGYMYHIDHSVPSTVSLENYLYARKLVEKYGGY